jgi:hypothetical protein
LAEQRSKVVPSACAQSLVQLLLQGRLDFSVLEKRREYVTALVQDVTFLRQGLDEAFDLVDSLAQLFRLHDVSTLTDASTGPSLALQHLIAFCRCLGCYKARPDPCLRLYSVMRLGREALVRRWSSARLSELIDQLRHPSPQLLDQLGVPV